MVIVGEVDYLVSGYKRDVLGVGGEFLLMRQWMFKESVTV